MKTVRAMAWLVLICVFAAALGARWLAPASYAEQFRESPNQPPSKSFPLGTDDLGRDRLSRLLYGTQVSLLLAPAAAALATLLAAFIGGLTGYLGGWWERAAMGGTDLVLSLPWLFLLLAVRAALPLNAPPLASVAITFLLLGLLGWASSARVVRAAARSLRESEFLLEARAYGCAPGRLFARHALPNLKPALLAQFWISTPVFILSEANLGLLGLGIAEPLPSLGNLLRELESASKVADSPWVTAPALLLVVVVICFQVILPGQDRSA